LKASSANTNAAAAGAALSYLGKDAIISADETYLAGGGEANWAYRMPESATEMTIKVRDMQGRVVYETTTAASRRRANISSRGMA
jgi:flagellar hook assembly protein FlgD